MQCDNSLGIICQNPLLVLWSSLGGCNVPFIESGVRLPLLHYSRNLTGFPSPSSPCPQARHLNKLRLLLRFEEGEPG